MAAPIAKYLRRSSLPTGRAPNFPGTSAYVRQQLHLQRQLLQPSDKWSAKVDQNLGSKHHLSYLMNRSKTMNASALRVPPACRSRSAATSGLTKPQVYRGNWDYTVSPTLINRFYGGFNHYLENQGGTSRD